MWNRTWTHRDRQRWLCPTTCWNALVQPSPHSPSKQPLNSTWIFKTSRWNKAEETFGFLYKPPLLDPCAAPYHSSPCTPRGSVLDPSHLLPTTSTAHPLLWRVYVAATTLPHATGDWRRLMQPSVQVIAVTGPAEGNHKKSLGQKSFWDHSSWKWAGGSARRPTPRLARPQAAAVEPVLKPQEKSMSSYCTKG